MIVFCEADSVAVGVYRLQVGGLFAPLLHTPPEHPPLHVTHDEPFHARGSEHVLHVGGLFAPFAHVCALTFTVTACNGDVPPGPVHWNVNVVLEVSWSVSPLPFKLFPTGGVRFDQGPPAIQLVASVEDHVSVGRPL